MPNTNFVDVEKSRVEGDWCFVRKSDTMFSGDLNKALPDNRPVTSICVIESLSGCPLDFQPVAKTYDQDLSADLWREQSFWRARESRYLCLSKASPSASNEVRVVQTVSIIGERDELPTNFSQITHTIDTGNKAWRRRQLVFRLSSMDSADHYVADIIILGRQRAVPAGFVHVGEIDGMYLCCKYIASVKPPSVYPSLNDSGNSVRNVNNISVGENNALSAATLAQTYAGLEGVPFILHPRLTKCRRGSDDAVLTQPYSLTKAALDKLIQQDFSTEQTVLQQS